MKDRKEAGFVYCDASSGLLNGIHIAPGHRGLGLSKPCVLYYVLFCRRFGLSSRETAHNRKPLFAKLYAELGYTPRCSDFPFLLLHRPPDGPQTPPPQQPLEEGPPPPPPEQQVSYVVPLAATNPRCKPRAEAARPEAAPVLGELERAALARLRLVEVPPTLAVLQRAWKLHFIAAHPDRGGSATDAQVVTAARDALHAALFPRENLEPDTSWAFTQRLAKSQDIVVVGADVARLAEPGAIGRTSMLYAKTAWWLPDDDAVAQRDATLAAIAAGVAGSKGVGEGGSERAEYVRCGVYSVHSGDSDSAALRRRAVGVE